MSIFVLNLPTRYRLGTKIGTPTGPVPMKSVDTSSLMRFGVLYPIETKAGINTYQTPSLYCPMKLSWRRLKTPWRHLRMPCIPLTLSGLALEQMQTIPQSSSGQKYMQL